MSRMIESPPARPATLRDVAESAGVSVATASRVLNGVTGKATAETVARVQKAAQQLAYRPFAAARDLRTGSSRLVAVLAPNLANPTMAAIGASIEEALRQDGLGLVLCDTRDAAEGQDRAIAEMRALSPRALVLLGAVASPGLVALRAGGEPVMFVARRCPGDPAAPFIGIDDHKAGRDVAQRLLATGAKRLAVVHGPLFSSATAERVAGFRAAAGAQLASADVLSAPGLDHFAIGATAAQALLHGKRRPQGIMCTSDLLAYAVHRVLLEAGGPMPVIWGFDGGPLNAWVAPWLHSVGLPYAAFGAAVRDWLKGGPAGAILPHRLP